MERELKLSVPEGFRRPPLDGAGGAQAGPLLTRRYTTTYHDSGDLALAAWGCSLRHRSGEGWTVKLAAETVGDLLIRPEHTFEGPHDVPPPAALALLAGFLRGRAIVPAVRARTTRRSQILSTADGTPVLEIVDDRVVAGESSRPEGLRQIEVELLEGSATKVLDEVLRRLRGAGARTGDRRTKYEWLLADRRPAPEVVVPVVTPDVTLGDAVRAMIGRSVAKLVHADAAVRTGGDPEAVHAARVSIRRLRSDLRSFGDVLETAWSERLRGELRWAADALGPVRDGEVLAARIEEDARRLDDPAAAEPIVATLRADVSTARAKLAAVMSTERHLALIDALVLAARSPLFRVPADGPAAELLSPAVERAWRRLRKAARAASATPTDAELHRVRIRSKQARYAAESLAPLLGRPAARFARRASRLQDTLGEHQDAVVAWTWLRDAVRGSPPDESFVAGQLAGLELQARQRARQEWQGIWKTVRRSRPGTWKT